MKRILFSSILVCLVFVFVFFSLSFANYGISTDVTINNDSNDFKNQEAEV